MAALVQTSNKPGSYKVSTRICDLAFVFASLSSRIEKRGNYGGFVLFLILLLGQLCLVDGADFSAGGYEVITERNAFGLRPKPAPDESANASSPAELPEIRLTGMYEQGGMIRVFLVREKRGGEPQHLSLLRGENREGVELLEANAREGSVRLRVSGVGLELSFRGQHAAEIAAKAAEERFVDDHARAHEALQHRLQEQAEQQAVVAPETGATQGQ